MLSQTVLFLLIISCAAADKKKENPRNVTNGRRFFGTMTKGFQMYKELGRGYKMIDKPLSWHAAKDKCVEQGGNLAVPRSLEEFTVLQGMVRQMKGDRSVVRLVWLGISNLEDHTVWVNLEGKNIEKESFHVWAGDNGQTTSDNPSEPHCAGMDGHNVGLREWWCARLQPALCEVPLDEQGRDVPWVPALGYHENF